LEKKKAGNISIEDAIKRIDIVKEISSYRTKKKR